MKDLDFLGINSRVRFLRLRVTFCAGKMSVLLADIDATCAALGYSDGQQYQAEPDAIQGLKVKSRLNMLSGKLKWLAL